MSTTKVSAKPPMPLNWNENLESTILSLSPYKLFPVDANALEYTTITALLHPLKIGTAERVVNPALWSRFLNTRKQMLLAKSDDLQLLTKLSTDDKMINQQMHISLSFRKDDKLTACPYDDNMALLFHCTKNQNNVDSILLQGLDERVSNGGNLGRGIYFASDPLKSIAYDGSGGTIFVFMVLLGDCLSVNQNQNFVKEPEKQPMQQRNSNDIHFDSIVGKPGGACEFVVYNRYQCCPLYKINYSRESVTSVSGNNIYQQVTNTLPPFCWTPMPNPSTDWPFYAKTIFTQMGVDDETDVPVIVPESAESIDNKLGILESLGFTNSEMNLQTLETHSFNLDRTINFLLELDETMIDESEILNNNKLSILISLGFTNAELNAKILKKNAYNLDECVSELLERDAAHDAKANDVAGPHSITHSPSEIMNLAKGEDCRICRDEYESVASNWKILKCGHNLCIQCYKQIETKRTTMSGIIETFTKCPFCMKTSGMEIGTCPDGTMTTTIVSTPCQGYEQYNSINIQYNINSHGYHLSRFAYLPNNREGNELLKLLQIAWDRRICFTIGTSATNGQENAVVWNIHHKTALRGGVESHGFPDATYMERCKLELKAHGIE